MSVKEPSLQQLMEITVPLKSGTYSTAALESHWANTDHSCPGETDAIHRSLWSQRIYQPTYK